MFEMRAVWEVLSSREEREVSLSTGVMPVFKEKPTREWRGHSSDVLDLNWSKVSSHSSYSLSLSFRIRKKQEELILGVCGGNVE